jgi:hypothetical protein
MIRVRLFYADLSGKDKAFLNITSFLLESWTKDVCGQQIYRWLVQNLDFELSKEKTDY